MKNSIVDVIGNTPLVKLNRIVEDIPAQVYAKLEFLNPSLSTKDRIVLKIIEDAEQDNLLDKDTTLIEATSGNTGISIAMIASVKGYKTILCVKDTLSKEKYYLMKSYGAKVVLCPAGAASDSPESYYSKAEALAKEIPNSFYLNQNHNTLNRLAHYESTGPEIWKQSKGKITHLIASASTGGTITGVAKFLKERNKEIKIWGVDTQGSVLKSYHEKGIIEKSTAKASKIDGVGKNIITDNFDFNLIDKFIRVEEEASADFARSLILKDGIWAGHSSGAVLHALHIERDNLTEDDFVVLLFSDHGSRYMSKLFMQKAAIANYAKYSVY